MSWREVATTSLHLPISCSLCKFEIKVLLKSVTLISSFLRNNKQATHNPNFNIGIPIIYMSYKDIYTPVEASSDCHQLALVVK